MKPHIFLAACFASLVSLSACKKEDKYMSEAVLTGYDQRTCLCCGGLMINFTGNPQPYASEFKIIKNDAEVGINSNEQFPIYVMVDWVSEPECSGNEIKVTRLKRK